MNLSEKLRAKPWVYLRTCDSWSLYPSAKGPKLTRCEYKNLKVEINIMISWMYRTFSFIEPQAFPSYSVIPYSLCSDQTTLECHSGNFGSITGSKKKPKQTRERSNQFNHTWSTIFHEHFNHFYLNNGKINVLICSQIKKFWKIFNFNSKYLSRYLEVSPF